MCFGLEGELKSCSTNSHMYSNMYCESDLYTGVPRKIDFPFCPCEENAVTLIKCQYWPGTSLNPKIAFSFELLDMLQALLLECQVAMQDFTQAMAYIIKAKIFDVCNLHMYACIPQTQFGSCRMFLC